MPLPPNCSIALQGNSRPGEGVPTKPKVALFVRLTQETLDAIHNSPLEIQFGDKPGFFINDKLFPMRLDREKENTGQELFMRTTVPNRPNNPPLRLNANVVGKLTVEQHLTHKMAQKVHNATTAAAKQKSDRKMIVLDEPPPGTTATLAPQKAAARKKTASTAKGSTTATKNSTPLVAKSYATSTPPLQSKPASSTAAPSTSSHVPTRVVNLPKEVEAHLRQRLIHDLALGAAPRTDILKRVGGVEADFDTRTKILQLLSEVAEEEQLPRKSTPAPTEIKWQLKPQSWLEVRPYQAQEYTDNVRMRVARSARQWLKTLGVSESDAAWEHVKFQASSSTTVNQQKALNGKLSSVAAAKEKAKGAKGKVGEVKAKSEASSSRGLVSASVPSQKSSAPAQSRPERDGSSSRKIKSKEYITESDSGKEEKEEGELSASQTPPRPSASRRYSPPYPANGSSMRPPPPFPPQPAGNVMYPPPPPPGHRPPPQYQPYSQSDRHQRPRESLNLNAHQKDVNAKRNYSPLPAAPTPNSGSNARARELTRERERERESDRESVRIKKESDREASAKLHEPQRRFELSEARKLKERVLREAEEDNERTLKGLKARDPKPAVTTTGTTTAGTKRKQPESSGDESSDWGYEDRRPARKSHLAPAVSTSTSTTSAVKVKHERESLALPKASKKAVAPRDRDASPPRKIKKEVSPFMSQSSTATTKVKSSKPTVGERERDRERVKERDRKMIDESSVVTKTKSKRALSMEEMKRRRQSADYTSSSDDDEPDLETRIKNIKKAKNGTLSQPNAPRPSQAQAPVSATNVTSSRPHKPPKAPKALSKHELLRSRYSTKYSEYILVFQKLVSQKNKFTAVLQSAGSDSEVSVSSEVEQELMSIEELEELSRHHQKLYDELKDIESTYAETVALNAYDDDETLSKDELGAEADMSIKGRCLPRLARQESLRLSLANVHPSHLSILRRRWLSTTSPDAIDFSTTATTPTISTSTSNSIAALPALAPSGPALLGANLSLPSLLMGISFGLLALSGLRPKDPHALLAAFTSFELRSLLFSFAIICIVLVLAYLTNPSETSFRTFLTEQAFRHHLSSLGDTESDDQDELEAASSSADISKEMLVTKGLTFKHRPLTSYASPPFAFANRASVSLRTPKHMFRSFGIFSVAAVVPSSNVSLASARSRRDRTQQTQQDDEYASNSGGRSDTTSSLWESWFIGAFGMWFWAVNLDGLWRESGFVTRDEVDGTVTGVLEVKALDRSDSHNRSTYSTAGNGHSQTGRRAPPKLRSRERVASQSGTALSHRSQTPPPLPKTASLPLHSKRSNQAATSDKAVNGLTHHNSNSTSYSSTNSNLQSSLVHPSTHHPLQSAPEAQGRPISSISLPVPPSSVSSPSSSPSRSPSSLFASSPVIADIFRQITASQIALNELRAQLSDFHALASSARPGLDDELEKQRERKRTDDTARFELKSQLKTLDDSKRTAEASRREAEKRLKQARSKRDDIDARTQRYEREIREFQVQMESQSAKIVASGLETGALSSELGKEVAVKKNEIRELEEEVAQLALRAREMEDKIKEEENRLERATETAKERKRISFESATNQAYGDTNGHPSAGDTQPPLRILTRQHDADMPQSPLEALINSPMTVMPPDPLIPSLLTPNHSASIPIGRKLTFDDPAPAQYARDPHVSTFSPFGNDLASPSLLSPTGERLLPSSLYESLGMSNGNESSPVSPVSPFGMDVSRSFQSEDDLILDRNWLNHRNYSAGDLGQTVIFPTGSQTMPVTPLESPREIAGLSHENSERERKNSYGSLGSRNSSSPMGSTESSFTPFVLGQHQTAHGGTQTQTPARKMGWFGSSAHKDKNSSESKARAGGDILKKGLNPDAKEFSLSKEKERSISALLHRRGHGHVNSNSTHSGSGSSSTPSSASLSTPENSIFNDSTLISNPPAIGSRPPSLTSPIQRNMSSTATTLTSKSMPPSSQPQSHSHSHSSPFGFGFGLGASSWFGSRAFEPTPLEREQFSLSLGSTANSSLDKLDHFTGVSASSSSASPQPVHAGAAGNAGHSHRSWDMRIHKLGFRSSFGAGAASNGHAHANANGKSSSFSPFEDDEPLSAPFSSSH